MANNSVTAAVGLACGVKRSGKTDLGLVVCPGGAKAAGVFTTNQVFAAPVGVCRKHLGSRKIFAAVVNSGNANACTGQQGVDDAVAMCAEVAGQVGCDPHEVLVASTGIIGEPLPIAKINKGIVRAAGEVSSSGKAGLDFAKAIMTTDTRPKQAVRKIVISGAEVVIGGTAKGAGMIGPNMATTICVLTTDIAISKPLLGRALKDAIGVSLNKLTVDGHQSTNDTALILASGAAGNRTVESQCPRYKKFARALRRLVRADRSG